jgi:hypothetical protein
MVVDANDVKVGRYGPALNLGGTVSAAAYLRVGGLSTTIPLTLTMEAQSTRFDYLAVGIYFSNLDCTGMAYITYASATGVLPSAIRKTDTQTLLYVADSADIAQNIPAHSIWVGEIPGYCSTSFGTPANGYQASTPPTDITTKYTRPFSVR